MRRFARRLLGLCAVLLALGVVATKLWLSLSGPYLEALPAYPFCEESATALAGGNVVTALELAEAGGCEHEERAARSEWDSLSATFARCLDGVWTGRAEDAAGLACAVASDLVVFGDVRDLTRQGLSWTRGEATDPVLIALSATGIALTLAPQFGAGASLFKVARKAGTMSERLADSVTTLVRGGAFKAVGGLLSDAGRISLKLGPARATRALQYADTAEELSDVARFVDAVDQPLLALRWGGKRTVRLANDPDLVRAATLRGPAGLLLAAERGGAALLARKPLLVTVAKTLRQSSDAVLALAAGMATWLLRWAEWRFVLGAAGALLLLSLLLYPRRRGRASPAGARRGTRPGPDASSAARATGSAAYDRHGRQVWRAGKRD